MQGKPPIKFAVLVAIVAAILYLPILSADFVYDDILQIKIDPYIHEHQHFWDVISLKVMTQGVLDNNRPVNLLSLMIDSCLYGKAPYGYHLTNLLLHSLTSAFVFIFAYGLLARIYPENKPLWLAFIGAMLFAIHPINSEAVCVIAFREDLLVTFFTILALIAAERFPTEKTINNFLLGGVIVFCIFAAAGAKESGIATPFLVLMYWLIIRRAEEKLKWIWVLGAGFATTLIFMILRFTIVPAIAYANVDKAAYPGGSFSAMLAIEPRIWFYQICELFWPGLMCSDLGAYSIRNISLAMAIAGLTIILIAAIIYGWKNKIFALGMIFYFLAMLPTSNIVPINWPIADRYLYFSMLGLSIAVSGIISRVKLKKDLFRIALILAVIFIGIDLCSFTIEREMVWHNSFSLWQDTVNKNPYSFLGNYNLGFALYNKGDYEGAFAVFAKASEIKPDRPVAKAAMAMAAESLGKKEEAEKYLKEAASLEADGKIESVIDSLLWTKGQVETIKKIAERISKQK